MMKKFIVLGALALSLSAGYAEYDYQVAPNAIGDWNLVTLGGYTLVKSTLIDLAPTNAPSTEAKYGVCCQVVYQDNEIRRPRTAEELYEARLRGALVSGWLKAYVMDEYVGADFSVLLDKYYSGAFAEDLNANFPGYVAAQIEAMPENARVDIEQVTVTIEAMGDFKAELVKVYESSK